MVTGQSRVADRDLWAITSYFNPMGYHGGVG